MNRDHDSIENDPIWDLLRQSPVRGAGPRFVDDTLRAARLSGQDPWWKKIVLPVALGGFASAATAAIVAFVLIQQPAVDSGQPVAVTSAGEPASLEVLDEFVRTEAVGIAAESPADFTDVELVSLIAF